MTFIDSTINISTYVTIVAELPKIDNNFSVKLFRRLIGLKQLSRDARIVWIYRKRISNNWFGYPRILLDYKSEYFRIRIVKYGILFLY